MENLLLTSKDLETAPSNFNAVGYEEKVPESARDEENPLGRRAILRNRPLLGVCQ